MGKKVYFARKRTQMQLTLPVIINPQLCFENFVIANNNHLIEHLLVREKQQCEVLYIYGKEYGKTHLLQALANKTLATHNVIYLNLKHQNPEILEGMLDTIDMLLLDNLEYATTNGQKIIFDIYNNSKHNFNLIISGAHTINQQDIFKDLQTRISQALSLPIYGLTDNEKITALEIRATHKNISIDSSMFTYLQKNYSRDLKKLMTILDTLSEKSLTLQKKITKTMIKSII
jgi:DnaA family protein